MSQRSVEGGRNGDSGQGLGNSASWTAAEGGTCAHFKCNAVDVGPSRKKGGEGRCDDRRLKESVILGIQQEDDVEYVMRAEKIPEEFEEIMHERQVHLEIDVFLARQSAKKSDKSQTLLARKRDPSCTGKILNGVFLSEEWDDRHRTHDLACIDESDCL